MKCLCLVPFHRYRLSGSLKCKYTPHKCELSSCNKHRETRHNVIFSIMYMRHPSISTSMKRYFIFGPLCSCMWKHMLTSDLKDDDDIGRERRALSVRANMLPGADGAGDTTTASWMWSRTVGIAHIHNMSHCCAASGGMVQDGSCKFFVDFLLIIIIVLLKYFS